MLFFPSLQLAVICRAFCQVFPFQSCTTKDDLISNRVLAMCQDSRGYLWIGTADGDGVYDEAAFKNYGPADGLSGTYVTAIAESKHSPGTMWIGTLDGGLSKFKDSRFT
jgi:ligand-binding sensor domain-containing protein